jgi:ATP-dependent helicase HrpA
MSVRFDPALPINARREDIRAAIERHPVVIVCGETGSGKTTQLPKILLDMGRAADPKRGRIGHTQPRRIAARSVAARIAEELDTELGGLVGFKVRHHDKVGEASAIKLMTDGILLAETQGDRRLRQYDSIILDEAHERSLNIDFLLGYLKSVLPARPDLKLIITSATIGWRCATARSKAMQKTPRARRRSRRSPMRSKRCAGRARAMSSSSCRGSGKSAMLRRRSASGR